jgi:hypothetical protein
MFLRSRAWPVCETDKHTALYVPNCLDNMGSSECHNSIGLQDLLWGPHHRIQAMRIILMIRHQFRYRKEIQLFSFEEQNLRTAHKVAVWPYGRMYEASRNGFISVCPPMTVHYGNSDSTLTCRA